MHLGVERMRPADLCVATSWETAYPVRDFHAARRKAYFVLDYEPAFFPAGAAATLAEATYGFGFPAVCGGRWLADTLRRRGSAAVPFRFGFDSSVYWPDS